MRIFARLHKPINPQQEIIRQERACRANIMTNVPQLAPEWFIQSWFNCETPLLLSGLRGRVVVLCAFQVLCRDSNTHGIPQALRIHTTFEPRDVAVVGLHATFEHHVAITPAVIRAYLHEFRIRFPVGLDMASPQGPIPRTMETYQMRGTPSLLLIDRHGFIRKHAFGPVDDLRLGAEIGALAQESCAAGATPASVTAAAGLIPAVAEISAA